MIMAEFFWLPCNKARHVLLGDVHRVRVASLPSERTTLCGLHIVVTTWEPDDEAWLWTTCQGCYFEAKGLR